LVSWGGDGRQVDSSKFIEWCATARTIVRKIVPADDHYIGALSAQENARDIFNCNTLDGMIGVLNGLDDDFTGGYLSDVRGLIRREVFADFIDEHLLDEGYFEPAGVLVSTVLEDHLRRLCAKRSSDTRTPDRSV
jgi:hypothetical protein